MSKDESKNKNLYQCISDKLYKKELKRLQLELVALQQWVVAKGIKVCIIFEGRDGAGKSSAIKTITDRVNPRIFRTVALPAPSEREKTQLYYQRYIAHLPAAGEIVLFDRSWYNRAGVERVMGFCTEQETKQFLQTVPFIEKAIVDDGIILIKYWLNVDMAEQEKRLKDRVVDGRKIWKLSSMDIESYRRWYDYSRARDEMIPATDTAWAPWFIVDSNDKKKARLNIISHLLSNIPYEYIDYPDITFPDRQSAKGYKAPSYTYHVVEDQYADKQKIKKSKNKRVN